MASPGYNPPWKQQPSVPGQVATPSASAPAYAPPWKQQSQEPPSSGDDGSSIFTRSVLKTAFGIDAESVYDKMRSYLPKSFDDTWVGKFSAEMARGGPEFIDAMTSPMGLALTAAHFVPRAKPVAVAADTVMGLMQAGRTIGSISEAGKDPSPEHVASAIKDMLWSYGFMKAGADKILNPKSLEIRARAEEYQSRLKEQAPQKGDSKKTIKNKLAAQRAITAEMTTPATQFEKMMHSVYQSNIPGVNLLARVMDLPKPVYLEMGQYMIDEHQAFTNNQEVKLRRLLDLIRRDIPEEDRKVQKLGYVIQGDLTPEEAGLSKRTIELLPQIRKYHKEASDVLRDIHGPDLKLHDPNNYLTQIWDRESLNNAFGEGGKSYAEKGTLGSRRRLRDSYLSQRKIESYKAGIEDYDLRPKFDDIADIIEARYKTAYHAAANFRMAKTLNDIGAIVGENRAQKRPDLYEHWPTAKSSVLSRLSYKGTRPASIYKTGEKAGTPKGSEQVTFERMPVRVHPDIKMAVEAIFGDPIESTDPSTGKTTAWGHIERVGALTKQSVLMSSLFHDWAISFQRQALMLGAGDFKGAAKSWFFMDSSYWKGLRSGWYEARGKRPPDAPPMLSQKGEVIYPWLEAGTSLNTMDRETAMVKWLRGLDTSTGNVLKRAVNTPLKVFGNAVMIHDRALFDFYLPSSQIATNEALYAAELAKNPNVTPKEAFTIRQNISQHTNKAYGTENLTRMLLSPQARQWAYRLLLAPQWTLSNLRMVTTGYDNETQKRLKERWLRGAAMSWFVGTQLMNYAASSWFSKDDQGNHTWKGHFTWDNPGLPMNIAGKYYPDVSENSINVFLGYNPDGSERYAMPFRAFSDPFKLAYHPLATAGAKLGPLPKMVIEAFTGVEPGSGYRLTEDDATPGERATQAIFDFVGSVTPIMSEDATKWVERWMIPAVTPVPSTRQFMSMPTFRGLTMTRAIQAYTEAMGDLNDAKTADQAALAVAKINKIMEVARQNKINTKGIISRYKADQQKRRKTARGPVVEFDTSGNPIPKTEEPPR